MLEKLPIASLGEIASKIHETADQVSKPVFMYERLAPFIEHLAAEPVRLLELGVHKGESLKIFASYFRKGHIIGVDLRTDGIDLSGFSNTSIETGDQCDAARLIEICSVHAPDGLDIIIDDASHYGASSRLSFDALFPRLKPGGLYVIEDWATGYWDDWPDGSRYERFAVQVPDGQIQKRMPSHDMGMVGFVKSLVDDTADKLTALGGRLIAPRTVEWISINGNFAILKKSGG